MYDDRHVRRWLVDDRSCCGFSGGTASFVLPFDHMVDRLTSSRLLLAADERLRSW